MKPLLLSFLIAAFSWSAEASELSVVDDPKLAHFIATLEHVATSEDLPFRVKIFRSYDRGECQGTPRSCPKDRVYLSVSTYDEAPEVRVFVSPDAYGWNFIRWGKPPDGDSPKDFVTVFMRRRSLGADPSVAWFDDEEVQVTLNPWKGTIELVEK